MEISRPTVADGHRRGRAADGRAAPAALHGRRTGRHRRRRGQPRLGRPATAGGSHGAYPAGNTTDGTQATYWEGPAGSFPQWVQVDLGEARDVERVVLKLPAGWESRTQTLSLQGSTDGSTFRTLDASSARAFDPARANTVALALDSPADTRYVRVHVTGNTGWNAAQLSELEVYGDDVVTEPPPTGTNLARNKPVEATSSVHSYVAAHATDDSTSTYWEAAGHPADLTVKLGADADVSAVVVKLNPDPIWSARTQGIQVLGRARGESDFTSLRARADYAFSPGKDNTVTIRSPAGCPTYGSVSSPTPARPAARSPSSRSSVPPRPRPT
ncbi:discoidin domain-containing protein [Streptomyces parvulus]|nr:discoidin domain-containing protein [Streptomyces parvulus]